MEGGDLRQLIYRPSYFSANLVRQFMAELVYGLNELHKIGVIHRDLKPENIMVTTTGLFDYPGDHSFPPNLTTRDVMVIVKLADFGLAREISSKPPYTEYVSARWYRAPELMLKSRNYSVPVDMWALGTVMAEVINLKPLFPGSGDIDQVGKIYEVLGDPAGEYIDPDGNTFGGGRWMEGVRLGKSLGFAFSRVSALD